MSKCSKNIIVFTRYGERRRFSTKSLRLYVYCSEKLREYLEDKNQQKIVEVKRIISGLSEAWKEIKE